MNLDSRFISGVLALLSFTTPTDSVPEYASTDLQAQLGVKEISDSASDQVFLAIMKMEMSRSLQQAKVEAPAFSNAITAPSPISTKVLSPTSKAPIRKLSNVGRKSDVVDPNFGGGLKSSPNKNFDGGDPRSQNVDAVRGIY